MKYFTLAGFLYILLEKSFSYNMFFFFRTGFHCAALDVLELSTKTELPTNSYSSPSASWRSGIKELANMPSLRIHTEF